MLQCTRRLAICYPGTAVGWIERCAAVSSKIVREDHDVPLCQRGVYICMARYVVAKAVHEYKHGFGERSRIRPGVEAVAVVT